MFCFGSTLSIAQGYSQPDAQGSIPVAFQKAYDARDQIQGSCRQTIHVCPWSHVYGRVLRRWSNFPKIISVKSDFENCVTSIFFPFQIVSTHTFSRFLLKTSLNSIEMIPEKMRWKGPYHFKGMGLRPKSWNKFVSWRLTHPQQTQLTLHYFECWNTDNK